MLSKSFNRQGRRYTKKFSSVLAKLKRCRPRDTKYVNKILKLLNNAKSFYDGKEIIINMFTNKKLPLYLEKKADLMVKMKMKMKLKKKIVLSILESLII